MGPFVPFANAAAVVKYRLSTTGCCITFGGDVAVLVLGFDAENENGFG